MSAHDALPILDDHVVDIPATGNPSPHEKKRRPLTPELQEIMDLTRKRLDLVRRDVDLPLRDKVGVLLAEVAAIQQLRNSLSNLGFNMQEIYAIKNSLTISILLALKNHTSLLNTFRAWFEVEWHAEYGVLLKIHFKNHSFSGVTHLPDKTPYAIQLNGSMESKQFDIEQYLYSVMSWLPQKNRVLRQFELAKGKAQEKQKS